MKVAQINVVCEFGSTGRIVADLSHTMSGQGIENIIVYGLYQSSLPNAHYIGNRVEFALHNQKSRLLDACGFGSAHATRQLIQLLEDFQPDVVHLHNIHGYYVHVELLFRYLKKAGCPVVWTLHDCWPFTGHCAHFDHVGCSRWQTGCGSCPSIREYPESLGLDRSQRNWQRKRQAFTGLDKCVLVSPSHWLAQLAQASFLQEYPVRVIPNGISLETFAPTPGDWKEKMGTEGKKVVLASVKNLHDSKGGQYLVPLARQLGPEYQIWVLGLNEPAPELHPLPYLQNAQQLAQVYTAADVFVNPTLEDNFPTVNLEALACGTPVVTFQTGGSPESIGPGCGAVVPQGDGKALAQAVAHWAAQDCKKACVAQAQQYERTAQYEKYVQLYRELL